MQSLFMFMSTKAGQFTKSYKNMQTYVKLYKNLFLFSLQATQSNIYGGAFLQRKLVAKSH